MRRFGSSALSLRCSFARRMFDVQVASNAGGDAAAKGVHCSCSVWSCSPKGGGSLSIFFFFLTGRFVRPHRRILPITAIEPCPRGPSAHVAVQLSPKLPKRASAGSRQSMRHSRRRSDGKVVDVDEARTQRHSRRRSYRRGHRCRRRGACDKVVATHMIFISYDVNNVKY